MDSQREMTTVINVKCHGSDGDARSRGDDDTLFKRAYTPITLKFEDVVYKVKVRKPARSMFFRENSADEEREILRGITGMVLPREIVGVLGPSGSGKTTLLTALGGRLGGGQLEGTVTYNGKAFSSALKRATGFVTQDDTFYPHLTVAETLTYAALLRLPKTLTMPEKVAHAEAVMNQLELTKCQDNIIGRGVSGGERKRVSIGQEMLLNPSLLLLDEPTSGLDSTIAERIVRTLWGLAKGGRTVVLTIHQPSSRLFYMFDKVLLLSEGNSLYFGKGRDAVDYFASVGYSPMEAMNPADFLLDLANGVAPEADDRDEATVAQTLIPAYKDKLEPMLKDELRMIEDHCVDDGCEPEDYGRWPITWWQEFSILLERGIKQRKADTFSSIKIAQVLGVALLCGFLWSQSNIHGLQDKIGLLFFLSSFWGNYPMYAAIFTFPVERPMLAKERSSGMYRLSSYFLARAAGDLPMDLVLPTAFLTITYWMSGMRPNLVSFIHTLVTLLYSNLVCQGIGLMIGALVMDISSAATLGSVVMMSSLLAGGYYAQKVPRFIAWIQYLSPSFYTYKLLLGSQFDEHSTYPCEGGATCNVAEYSGIREVGLGGQAPAAVVLGIMLVGVRAVAYLVLTRVGVTKN